jgi:hypothetical protein
MVRIFFIYSIQQNKIILAGKNGNSIVNGLNKMADQLYIVFCKLLLPKKGEFLHRSAKIKAGYKGSLDYLKFISQVKMIDFMVK